MCQNSPAVRLPAPSPEMPEPEGLSEQQLAELDRFFGTAVYGDRLSCLQADRLAGEW